MKRSWAAVEVEFEFEEQQKNRHSRIIPSNGLKKLKVEEKEYWDDSYLCGEVTEEERSDYISELPDAILISIISRLTTREAAATSVLATRWRHLHAYTDRLTLVPTEPLWGRYWKLCSDYSNMINCTIHSHKGAAIKEFKLDYLALKEESYNYKGLMEFALSKKVEKIDISKHRLLNFAIKPSEQHSGYSFIVQSIKGLSSPHLREVAISGGVCFADEDVEVLLSKSPLLERLSVSDSSALRNVSISGHLKLKWLYISEAVNVESTEVVDMANLIYLRCNSIGSRSGYVLKLENVPKLAELGVDEEDGGARILSGTPQCVLDRIQKLKIWPILPPFKKISNWLQPVKRTREFWRQFMNPRNIV